MEYALLLAATLAAPAPKAVKPVLRVYQVADLLTRPGGSEALLKTIRGQVEPKSWFPAGAATIEFHPLTLSIVVVHKHGAQTRIRLLLEAARREARRRGR